jgi:RNA polymerase sigma factor (TIGR02999 family)
MEKVDNILVHTPPFQSQCRDVGSYYSAGLCHTTVPDYAESDPLRVTLLLQRLSAGHHSAADELLPLVYGELHRIARSFFRHQPSGHTLQPTALVNEAYIRFFDKEEPPPLTGRAHFLALMARVMRQILVDHARAVATGKRGGRGKVTWDTNIEVQGATAVIR